ncbi:PLP-dependent aminotransferase family protein [Salinispirillum sp. LH 10-3-1]|uniref:PLP-dependent aminotransferase family protein n=1 Tax=Salinispirillum sp. LH 10-3-1 TaxID=2952525 RepID=A0AB38YF50_9GAMM
MTIWNPSALNLAKPKYQALADAIADAIAEGELGPGSRLPAQRLLADRLGVTVGTITRAYAEAERRGLLVATVGSGTYVREKAQSEGFQIQERSSSMLDLGFTLAVEKGQTSLLGDHLRNIADTPELLNALLDYVPETGLAPHRAAAQTWLAEEGIHRHTDDILWCHGGQNALFTCLHALCESGDTVLSDGITYSGFILAARYLHCRHVGLPMDNEGLIPHELRIACERYRPRVLYLMPQLHNPTGVQMSDTRKRELLAICAQYDVMVIEDNVQTALLSDKPTPMVAIAPDQVVVLSSCSKAMVGGLRTGFLVPPPAWRDRFRMALRVSSWMVAPLLAELTSRWIRDPQRPEIMRAQRADVVARQALAQQILGHHGYRAHPEALHGWLPMTGQWRAVEFAQLMASEGVAVKPAEVFAVGQFAAPQALRLCIGAPLTHAQLTTALQTIATALQAPSADAHWLNQGTI